MSEDPPAQKIPLVFFSTSAGHKPVRDWLKVALHGFIKKTRTTPDEDLELARKRKKELDR